MNRRNEAAIIVVALIATAIAYANSLPNGFHFDDGHSIQDNVWLRSLRHIPRYFWDVATFSPLAENRSYRPALLVGFAVSHALGGGAPWAYRLLSIVMHALAAAVVGLMTVRLWRAQTGRDGQMSGVIAAAWMAIHPLATEAVNYASARSSLQAAALMFLSLYFYVWAREERRRTLLFVSAVALGVAMATKIIAITAPALAVLWALTLGPERMGQMRGTGTADSGEPGRTNANRVRRSGSVQTIALTVVPLAVVAFGFTVFHEWMVGPDARAARSSISPYSFFLTETRVWMRYQLLFLWPNDLCADLTMRWSRSLAEPAVMGAIAWTAGLVSLAVVSGRNRPLVTFGILWFYIALSPTNSFVPLSEPASEHRVYIALPGLIWAAIGIVGPPLVGAWPVYRLRLIAAGAALAIALTATTLLRNLAWRNGESLWGSVLECAPDNGRAHLNFGRARMTNGDYDGAAAAFDRCQSLLPNWIFCRINHAALALASNRLSDAERHMAEARRLQPNNIYTLTWSAKVHLAQSRYGAAQRAFRRALGVAPGYEDAERGLTEALLYGGRSAEADTRLSARAANGRLDADGWFLWGWLAEQQSNMVVAEERYRRALTQNPRHPRARAALERLGR